MPTYNYFCNNCGATFERFRKISEREDGGECNTCGSAHTSQAVSAPSMISGSGGGWYGQSGIKDRGKPK